MAQNASNADWSADRARYPARAWLTELSLPAVAVYRFGRWARCRGGIAGRALNAVYLIAYYAVRVTSGIEIPASADIGPGLRIYHFGSIVINGGTVIGARCRMRQNVTIGVKARGGPTPVLGDDVFVGAYVQILGDVRVGDGATIGGFSLVVDDVPAGATVVGIPARVVTPGPGPGDRAS